MFFFILASPLNGPCRMDGSGRPVLSEIIRVSAEAGCPWQPVVQERKVTSLFPVGNNKCVCVCVVVVVGWNTAVATQPYPCLSICAFSVFFVLFCSFFDVVEFRSSLIQHSLLDTNLVFILPNIYFIIQLFFRISTIRFLPFFFFFVFLSFTSPSVSSPASFF